MEIYRNEQANVDLLVPVTAISGTFVVEAYEGSTLLYTFPTVAVIPGGYRVTLPFSLVDSDRAFSIRWQFDYIEGTTKTYKNETFVSVVTPYATVSEIRSATGIQQAQVSDEEMIRLERRIRGVIDNYTRQSFGRYSGTRQVIGAGDCQLKTSQRIVRLDSIAGPNIISPNGTYYNVFGDGWYVGFTAPAPDGEYPAADVIRDPDAVFRQSFKDNYVYSITGIWGWEDVPAAVKEAALILCEDELCPQSEYRDRYLKSISGDGWRYEFNPNAYLGTGSVIADQILSPYVYTTFVVI